MDWIACTIMLLVYPFDLHSLSVMGRERDKPKCLMCYLSPLSLAGFTST